MSRLALTVAAGLLALPAAAAPHPHYDNGSSVNWKLNLKAALDVAARTGKPVFVDVSIDN